jgi:hypothetical protein
MLKLADAGEREYPRSPRLARATSALTAAAKLTADSSFQL